jgi:hypothetical protein
MTGRGIVQRTPGVWEEGNNIGPSSVFDMDMSNGWGINKI